MLGFNPNDCLYPTTKLGVAAPLANGFVSLRKVNISAAVRPARALIVNVGIELFKKGATMLCQLEPNDKDAPTKRHHATCALVGLLSTPHLLVPTVCSSMIMVLRRRAARIHAVARARAPSNPVPTWARGH